MTADTPPKDDRPHDQDPGGCGCAARPGALDAAPGDRRREGVALTPSRQRILEILAATTRPLGAYELIDRVASETGKRPAPISIYRALDFLLDAGLVHRLASRNAYLACAHGHARETPIVFLICEGCGEVVEAHSDALHASIVALASAENFMPRTLVMEAAGTCARCAATS